MHSNGAGFVLYFVHRRHISHEALLSSSRGHHHGHTAYQCRKFLIGTCPLRRADRDRGGRYSEPPGVPIFATAQEGRS